MAQGTFNNGDTLGVARTTINSNASDAETRLGILENDTSSFSYTEVTVAQSPYTLPAWDGIYGLHNDTAKIDLVLPEATVADVGKEIEFWVEHNPANHKVILKAPSQSMSINNVSNDGVDVARAEFNSNFPNFMRIKVRCVGENKVYVQLASSVYSTLRYLANFSSTSDFAPYSYLSLDSIPTNFMTSNADWWFAVKVESPMTNDSEGQVLFGSDNFFVAYRGNGQYFHTSGTSGYFQTVSPTTLIEGGEWMVYQYDSSADQYTAWINGAKVLDSTTGGVTPPSTAPTSMWFGTEQVDLSEDTGITLSVMTDARFNQDYTPISLRGRYASASDDYNDPTGTEFVNYSYFDGSNYYWLTNNQNTAEWTVVETAVNPSTFVNDSAVSAISSEAISSSSTTIAGVYAPSPSLASVTYDLPLFPTGYGYPLQDCKISNISIGSGNLSDADAALFTSSTFTVPTLSSATLTNQWSPANGDVITTVTGSTNLSLVGSSLSTEEI